MRARELLHWYESCIHITGCVTLLGRAAEEFEDGRRKHNAER